MFNLSNKTPQFTPLRTLTLDDLWAEAETLGAVRVYTKTSWDDRKITGYRVCIVGVKRNTTMEVERENSNLHFAMLDAINEAREMGRGERNMTRTLKLATHSLRL